MCNMYVHKNASKAISVCPIELAGELLMVLFWTLKRVDIHSKVCSEDIDWDSPSRH